MNILIIGEFSAFAKHLKNGFKQLGHQVWIVQKDDGFKKITLDKEDILYHANNWSLGGHQIRGSYIINNLFTVRFMRRRLMNLPQLDLIVIINYIFVARNYLFPGVPLSFIEQAKDNGCKVIVSCCGGDPALRYGHKFGHMKYVEEYYGTKKESIIFKRNKVFDTLLKMADSVIPTSYDYLYPIKLYCRKYQLQDVKIGPTIPLPITIEPFDYKSCQNRKIIIFHGVIREQMKGTKYFVDALKKLSDLYPDLVDCRVDGKMPYDKYVQLFKDLDILLDQTNGYGFGMNAALGLMNGKVVLGGNEIENEDSLGLGPVPIINATPNSEQIFSVLENLVLNPQKLDEIKEESRKFAVRCLDSKIIAKRYLNQLFSQ